MVLCWKIMECCLWLVGERLPEGVQASGDFIHICVVQAGRTDSCSVRWGFRFTNKSMFQPSTMVMKSGQWPMNTGGWNEFPLYDGWAQTSRGILELSCYSYLSKGASRRWFEPLYRVAPFEGFLGMPNLKETQNLMERFYILSVLDMPWDPPRIGK